MTDTAPSPRKLTPDKADRARALLAEAARDHAPAALASSMGAEDMALIHMITEAALPIAVFTLDTGRLHPETYSLIQLTRARYRLPIEVYAPDTRAVEAHSLAHGPEGFYGSIEVRKDCCRIRKVEPLRRALKGRKSWITGMRRGQSVTRSGLEEKHWDADNGLMKFNPLADWTADEVWAYIAAHDVPTNPLHKKGYVSIGCAPCTRAIAPGEDERAGRWWWESPEFRECGLHAPRKRA